MRGQKDYELALKDIEEAEKLEPTDKDALRFKKLTLEDIELERTIKNIMSNAELLKGKEYLDFLLDFLQGKKDGLAHAVKKFCYHEITEEESKKLSDNL